MKISPNIDDDERDCVFNTAVGIVGLCGALITRTWPRVVARIPLNMLFNLGRVTGSVRAVPFFYNIIQGNMLSLKHMYHPQYSSLSETIEKVPIYPFYFSSHVNHYPALEIRSTLWK